MYLFFSNTCFMFVCITLFYEAEFYFQIDLVHAFCTKSAQFLLLGTFTYEHFVWKTWFRQYFFLEISFMYNEYINNDRI